MAQSGYTPISLYYSTVTGNAPTAGGLVDGELAINTRDGKLYYKSATGAVTLLANASSSTVTFPLSVSNGGTGITTLSTGRIPYGAGTSAFQSSSSLTFNGTALVLGPGSELGGATNPYLAVTGNTNGYIQQYIYNANSGTHASSDFAAYPDNGLDSSGWIDMGITSSTFADTAYSVTTFNEGYILMSAPNGASKSGNLVYATDSTGTTNSHQWYVGGFNQAKSAWKMQLTSTGLQLANALAVAYGGTGQTSYTDGQLLIGNSTGNTLTKATLTAGTGVSITNGNGSITISATGTGGTVTSVSFTGGIISVANPTTTPALTVAGTSGGIPYFSSASTWASSGVLATNALVVGGGAGNAPATITTGTNVVTALGVNVGTAGSFIVNGGALGTPASGDFSTGTFTWPTFNQNTTGSAAKWTTARLLANNSVDGSANVAFANKFIVQGTTDAGLSGAQFLGALGTGLVKNTTTTGVLSIATAGTDYAPATSGTSILKGNGSGGFANAASGTDYAPATSGSSILYGNGAGGFSNVTVGTGLSFSTGTLSNSSPMTYPGAGIAVSTGSAWTTSLTAPSGAIVGTTDTQTLTNKRVTPRIGTTTSAATITPTADLSDQYNVTALATTAAFAIPSGTPTNGQKLTIRIKDSGSGQTMSWTTTAGGYRVIGTTLPTSIAAGKTIYVGCIYNSADAYWDVVSVATEA